MPPPNDAARFLPGQVLGGRYRAIERVGKGGMGEVYRADDLRLGEQVALKFLPAGVHEDPARLDELFAEVRLARQVSHPNVCRVHDVLELDGAHALSMEFVDGEDLASLLRRIGRLPAGKACQIVHEACAGLAAIHDRGVLHRDLKPANIMLDGRGHVRITDFGLAGVQGRASGSDAIVGTPAYMAPESFAGADAANVRADLYSLGLVMYEMFTGKPAFEWETLQELIQARRSGRIVSPTRHVPELDPRIERAIMRCLEAAPARRPASARDVAAVLPGGDRIAEAIAAGDTPSPELVAAATGGDEGFRPAWGWTLLVGLAAGLFVLTAVAPYTRLVPRLPLVEPPQAMAGQASHLLRDVAAEDAPRDRGFGYEYDVRAVDRIVASDHSRSRWDSLSANGSPVVSFWYRESPHEIVPPGPTFRMSSTSPPLTRAERAVRLDMAGRPVQPDALANARTPDPSRLASSFVLLTLRPILMLVSLLAGGWLARRNLRARRADLKRAQRLALTMMALSVAAWALGSHHTLGSLTVQLTTSLAWGLYDFAFGWIVYTAIEPYVRRLWPRILTAWTRLLDGRFADARVGRELLAGCVAGVAMALLVAAHQALPVLFGGPPGRPDNVGYVENQLASLLGPRAQLAEMVTVVRSNLQVALGFMVILVLARFTLRHRVLAILGALAVFVPLGLPRGDIAALNVALPLVGGALMMLALFRFGLLAATVAMCVHAVLETAPLGLGLGTWATDATLIPLVFVFGLGLYGFTRSLGGRPALRDPLATE